MRRRKWKNRKRYNEEMKKRSRMNVYIHCCHSSFLCTTYIKIYVQLQGRSYCTGQAGQAMA